MSDSASPTRRGSSLRIDAPLAVDAPGLMRTQRLVLRRLTSSDRAQFERILALSGDHLLPSKLWRQGDDPRRIFDRQLSLAREGDRTGRAWRRAAFLADGRLAGCLNLNDIRRGLTFTAELSWWLAPEHCGQGLALEGAAAVLDHALADLPLGLGLHSVRAVIRADNAPSLRLASRLGLRPTGQSVPVPGVLGWESHEVWEIAVTLPQTQIACHGPTSRASQGTAARDS